MYKAVIFDFDGTLADTGSIAYKIYLRLLHKYNLPRLDRRQLEELNTLPIRERFRKTGVPLYKLPRLVGDVLALLSEYIGSVPLFPEMDRLLEELQGKGITLAITSSNSRDNISSFLKVHGLDCFQEICANAGFFGKHRFIVSVIKRLGLEISDALYVGDELRDILSCKKIGVKIVAATWGYDHRELLSVGQPDYLADKPMDVMDCLGLSL